MPAASRSRPDIADAALARVVEAQRHVERIERCPQQLSADAEVVGVVGVPIGSREIEVLLVAGAFLPETAQTHSGDVFDDRYIQHAAEHRLVVVAVLEVGESLEVGARWNRDDVHRATRGVAPVEGALGSAENFDAFDIEEGERGDRSRAVLIDAVDVDRRRLIGALGIRNAADRDLRLAPLLAEMHAGNEGLEILHLRDAGGIELVTHDGRRRGRHLLQCLGALLYGDCDRFDARVRAVVGIHVRRFGFVETVVLGFRSERGKRDRDGEEPGRAAPAIIPAHQDSLSATSQSGRSRSLMSTTRGTPSFGAVSDGS